MRRTVKASTATTTTLTATKTVNENLHSNRVAKRKQNKKISNRIFPRLVLLRKLWRSHRLLFRNRVAVLHFFPLFTIIMHVLVPSYVVYDFIVGCKS